MNNLITRGIVLMFAACVSGAYGEENASNPLAAINNTDLRAQSFDLGGPELKEYWVDGAYMATPKLKLKYELHYMDTDVTGESEGDWESIHIKPIYFPTEGDWGDGQYRSAVGFEIIADAGNEDKGIGSGSDQIAPLAALSLSRGNTVLIPLVQHFVEFNGPDVNMTAFRLIGIQSLPKQYWGKLDAIVPIDWENDKAIPATFEVQLGKMFSSSFGLYVDGLFGVGTDRPYDWGVGIGLRFNS